MQSHWIESIADFKRIAPAWDRTLLESREDNPFVHSDFIQAWWRHYGQGRRLWIFALTEGERVLGGMPLFEDSPGRLEQVGRNAANYTELLAGADPSRLWENFLQALSGRRGWRRLLLKRVRQSRLRPWGLLAGRHPRLRVVAPETEVTYLLDIPAEIARLPKQIHPKLWAVIRPGLRKLHQRGSVHLDRVRTPEQLGPFMEQFIRFHKAAFRQRRMRSNFEEQAFSDFFSELTGRFLERGFLEAYTLKAGGEAVAMGLGYSLTGNANDILTTFNPALHKLRPGHLLLYKWAEECSRSGRRLMDFYTGRYQYKRHFSSRTEPVHTVEIRPRNLTGWAGETISMSRWRLRAWIRSRPALYQRIRRMRGLPMN